MDRKHHPNNFKKERKLCSKKRVEELFKRGESQFSYPFKVTYLEGEKELSRALISVPKRIFKRAVDRNRVKRLVRETLRHSPLFNSRELSLDMAVLFVGKEIPTYREVSEILNDVLDKIEERYQAAIDPPISTAD